MSHIPIPPVPRFKMKHMNALDSLLDFLYKLGIEDGNFIWIPYLIKFNNMKKKKVNG